MLAVISAGYNAMPDMKYDKNQSQFPVHNHKRKAISLVTEMKPIQFNVSRNFLNSELFTTGVSYMYVSMVKYIYIIHRRGI